MNSSKWCVSFFLLGIVRPDKKDWGVLSEDPPVDISMTKCISVKRFTPVYLCSPVVVLIPIVRKMHFELLWITRRLASLVLEYVLRQCSKF